jgi:hypothetical protein
MSGAREQFLRHAQNCQAMADAATSCTAKELFENLADTWTRMADDHEHTKALHANWFQPKVRKVV